MDAISIIENDWNTYSAIYTCVPAEMIIKTKSTNKFQGQNYKSTRYKSSYPLVIFTFFCVFALYVKTKRINR